MPKTMTDLLKYFTNNKVIVPPGFEEIAFLLNWKYQKELSKMTLIIIQKKNIILIKYYQII